MSTLKRRLRAGGTDTTALERALGDEDRVPLRGPRRGACARRLPSEAGAAAATDHTVVHS